MSNQKKALGTGLENRVVERARAKGLEAKKQPLSGVLKDYPHDCVIEGVLVECKVRSPQIDAKGQQYIRLNIDWLLQTIKDAEAHGFDSAVLVVNAKGSREPMVMLRYNDYLTLRSEAKARNQAD